MAKGKFSHYNRSVIGTCKDCEDRHPACHDTCERYQQAKDERDSLKEKIKNEKMETRVFAEYKVNKIAKERKHGRVAGRRI